MATRKVGDLPIATEPFEVGDLFHLVQDAVDKKTSIAAVSAWMRLTGPNAAEKLLVSTNTTLTLEQRDILVSATAPGSGTISITVPAPTVDTIPNFLFIYLNKPSGTGTVNVALPGSVTIPLTVDNDVVALQALEITSGVYEWVAIVQPPTIRTERFLYGDNAYGTTAKVVGSLNDLTKSGFYSTAAGVTEQPSAAAYLVIHVQDSGASNKAVQIAIAEGTGYIWWRTNIAGTWSAWISIEAKLTAGAYEFARLLDKTIAQASTGDTTLIKVAEYKIRKGGVVRVSYNFGFSKTGGVGGTSSASFQVWKNGSAFGTLRTLSSISTVAYSEDLAFADGDLIQFYLRAQGTFIPPGEAVYALWNTLLLQSAEYGARYFL